MEAEFIFTKKHVGDLAMAEFERRHMYTPKRVGETIRNPWPKPGRNDTCPCQSGKKYKRCCLK